MKRTFKRIKVAWQILIGRCKYLALTTKGDDTEAITNLNTYELGLFAQALKEQTNDTICDPEVTKLKEVVCLN